MSRKCAVSVTPVLGWRNAQISLAYRLVTRNIVTQAVRKVPEIQNDATKTYKETFQAAKPTLLKRGIFKDVPAARKWFQGSLDGGGGGDGVQLNLDYLEKFGDSIVPLEFTSISSNGDQNPDGCEINGDAFEQREAPLSFFLEFIRATQKRKSSDAHNISGVYLAQCSLSQLHESLRSDLPTPEFVRKAGRGDAYDSSIWIGLPPTFTPLHRDPNPNFFVQLAGSKIVRLIEPAVGNELFQRIQKQLQRTGSAAIRGEEMMQGKEKQLLKSIVWGSDAANYGQFDVVEASLGPGDGLFIPKGWWHSVIGHGKGIVGSVNWWFR